MMKNAMLLVLLLGQLILHLSLVHVEFLQSYVFTFVHESMSWSGAQTYCRQHHTDLATINDRMDLDELMRSVDQGYSGDVWIGLYRSGESAPWIWSDQSKSTFMPWGPGQPNNWDKSQYCVAVVNGSSVNDLSCALTLPSICYTDRKRQIVKLEVKSGENLNDPEVKNKVLSEMEQILKEKGLAENAKLSWRIQSDGNVFQKKDQKKNAIQQTCFS